MRLLLHRLDSSVAEVSVENYLDRTGEKLLIRFIVLALGTAHKV